MGRRLGRHTFVAVVDRLIVPLEGAWRVPVALAFVRATVALAVALLRAGKRVPVAGAAAQVGLLGFFTLTVVLYAVRHGVHAPSAGDLAPSWAVFALVAPVLVYNFLGVELPSAAGEELRDPARDVRPRSSAPVRSPAPCTRSRCWPSSWSSRPTGSPA